MDDEEQKLKGVDEEEFHEVMIANSDTFEGICLRHKVKAQTLRRLNHLSSNSIHSLKTLRLPGQPIQEDPEVLLKRQRLALLDEFMHESKEGDMEAQYYLENNSWKIEFALAEWKNDDEAASKTC